jgi:hypothetical protein
MAAGGLIEGRNAHQAVNAGFTGKQAVGVFTAELNRGVLDARFFAGRLVEQVGGDAVALGPAEIHAQEDGCPILRFGAAGAGLDGHDGVEVVGFSGEERFGFQFGDVGIGGVEFAVQLFQQVVLLLDVGFLLREMDVRLDVAGEGRELIVGGDLFFGALAFAENALGGFLIVPEIGGGDARFESFQALAVLRGVKDNSARDGCAA